VSVSTVFSGVEVSKVHDSALTPESPLCYVKWAPDENSEGLILPPLRVEVFRMRDGVNLVVRPSLSVGQVRNSSFEGDVVWHHLLDKVESSTSPNRNLLFSLVADASEIFFIHRPLADSIVTEAFSAHKRFANVIIITEFACKSDNVCFMLEVQLAAVSVVPEGYVYSSSLSDTFDVETFSELSKESIVSQVFIESLFSSTGGLFGDYN